MNFAFYVSGGAGRLRELIKRNSQILHKTKLIISDSNSNSDLELLLQSLNITFYEFNYNEMKQNGESKINLKLSNFLLNALNMHNIDYCFCFGDNILKGQLLDTYRNRIINLHPSILPMYPGRLSIDQALKDESTILLGHTAHFIDEGMDTGPIIMQSIVSKSFFIDKDYDKLLNLQIEMLEFIYLKLLDGCITIKNRKVIIEKFMPQEPSIHFNYN